MEYRRKNEPEIKVFKFQMNDINDSVDIEEK